MPTAHRFGLALWLSVVVFTTPGIAGETAQIDEALRVVTNTLPPGWTVETVKTNEIPYGHHWNENYTGPRGILVIAKGTRPVNAEFSDTNGNWHAVHVATESLEIWLMPGNYSESVFGWMAIGRPITATTVVNHGPIKVYARPSHVLLSEVEFNRTLSKFQGIRWPDSPVNSPKLLSWKNWRLQLKKAIEKEFGD
jgi:hypothetical protein